MLGNAVYYLLSQVGSGGPFDNSFTSFTMGQPPNFLAVTARNAPTEWEMDFIAGTQ